MARLMFYILAAMVLMTLDFRGEYLDRFRALTGYLVEPVFMVVEAPFVFAGRTFEGWQDRRDLLAERDEFRQSLQETHARILLLEDLARDNRELRGLLGAAARVDADLQAVELRRIDLNPYSHRVIVNRGTRDGVAPGQPVIDASGVFGQVDQSLLHSAQVILITDPDHALPVRVERTALRTIAYGSGRTDELRLTDLPMNVDLEPGDRLITSGLGGRFPSGLPVAEVTDVRRPEGEAFATALARPLAGLERARHLLVLMQPEPLETRSDVRDADIEAEADSELPRPGDETEES
jgi:rod shape-determining protein MreC